MVVVVDVLVVLVVGVFSTPHVWVWLGEVVELTGRTMMLGVVDVAYVVHSTHGWLAPIAAGGTAPFWAKARAGRRPTAAVAMEELVRQYMMYY